MRWRNDRIQVGHSCPSHGQDLGHECPSDRNRSDGLSLSARSALRFRHLEQRSGRTSALPCPPSRRKYHDGRNDTSLCGSHREGILSIGKAQEKAYVVPTITKKHPETGRDHPWLMKSSAMVNHYYFYCVHEDFGPFFIKFCSYFPYDARLCINGHEYAKRRLDKRGIKYEPLDNGILSGVEV